MENSSRLNFDQQSTLVCPPADHYYICKLSAKNDAKL
jgi:hypothetical protein